MQTRELTEDPCGGEKTADAAQTIEEPYRPLFEKSPQPMWVYDVNSLVFDAVNHAAVELCGYSQGEFLCMTIRDICLPGNIPEILDDFEPRDVAIDKSNRCELRRKNGSLVEVELSAVDIAWYGHAARLVTGTAISGRPRTTDSYRGLLEQAPDAILVHRQGKIIFANAACARLYGSLSVKDLLGKQYIDFVHPNDREDVLQINQQFAQDTEYVRRRATRLLPLDGRELYAEAVARSIMYESELAVEVIFRDISERLQAEKKLRRKEADLATAQRIAHLGSYEMDLLSLEELEKNPLEWSDENFRIFGYEPGQFEVFGSTFAAALHPDDRSRILEALKRGIHELNSINLKYRIIRPNGAIRFLQSRTNVIFDERTNRPIRLVGITHDITESQKAEEKFYKAFNANPEPMTIATLSEGRYIDVNENFLRVTGHQREEIIGSTSVEMKFWKFPDERLRFAELLKKQGSIRDLEVTFLTKSGEERIALDSAEIVEFDGEKCIVAIFKDITEQKNLEKQLRQSQKMEAIGRLSGGIAHDFNNLLGVIIGYSEILEERIGPDQALHQSVQEIKNAGNRAALLTRQLLAFSRQQVLEMKVLDVNAIVRNVQAMLKRLIGENIDLQSALDPDLGNIKADQGQIEQVIINLAVNARDAMRDGGRLTIATANIDVDEEFARMHPPQPPGKYILLSVSDTGIGMDAITQARIFEPFFTTKEREKGTGLGLSTVYGVIRQSGGHIWVYSEPGLGTNFKIYLPRTNERAKGEKATHRRVSTFGGTETILLVEDEERLRELTRALLVDRGYTVLSAEHPADALELARQYMGPIHLLLTDVVMPGISGLSLARKLAAPRPDMKVVYMSGYTRFTHPELFDSDATVLFKPVPRDVLLRRVHEVLALDVASQNE
jgi:two-component system cell cycle sensor histidine kinase/response regulator CckA